jgi:hypothetical protein
MTNKYRSMESLIRQVVGESYNQQIRNRSKKSPNKMADGIEDGAKRNASEAAAAEERKENKKETRENEIKRREQETDRRSREGSIREEENSNPGTETRRKIKLVARPDDSPKNKIPTRQNAIQTNVIDEGKPFMFNDNKFGLTASLINAARAIVEGEVRKIDGGGKTPVEVNPSLDMNTEEEKPTRSPNFMNPRRARTGTDEQLKPKRRSGPGSGKIRQLDAAERKRRETVQESFARAYEHYGTHTGTHSGAIEHVINHMKNLGWEHSGTNYHSDKLSAAEFAHKSGAKAFATISNVGRKPNEHGYDIHTSAFGPKKAVREEAESVEKEFSDEEIEHLDYIASTLDEARKKIDAPSKAPSKPKKVKTPKAGPKAEEQPAAPEPEPSTSKWGKPLSQDEISAGIAKRYAGLKDNLKNAGWNHSGTQPTREGKTHTFTGMGKHQYGNLGKLHNALRASGFISTGSHIYKHNNGSTIHVLVAPHSIRLKHHEPKNLHEEDMSEVFDSGHHTGHHGLSPKQMKIARIAGNPNDIDAKDLAALRAAKKKNK